MDYILVKKDKLAFKIQFTDILYIGINPKRPRVLRFVTDGDVYEAYGKLKDFELRLGLTFKRCHRKYLVNLRRVKAIDMETRQVLFDNSKINSIECSRRSFIEVLNEWKSL